MVYLSCFTELLQRQRQKAVKEERRESVTCGLPACERDKPWPNPFDSAPRIADLGFDAGLTLDRPQLPAPG